MELPNISLKEAEEVAKKVINLAYKFANLCSKEGGEKKPPSREQWQCCIMAGIFDSYRSGVDAGYEAGVAAKFNAEIKDADDGIDVAMGFLRKSPMGGGSGGSDNANSASNENIGKDKWAGFLHFHNPNTKFCGTLTEKNQIILLPAHPGDTYVVHDSYFFGGQKFPGIPPKKERVDKLLLVCTRYDAQGVPDCWIYRVIVGNYSSL